MALPLLRSSAPLRRRRARSEGFSLIELVVALLISAVILVAAVKALLSLIRGDAANQQELSRKNDMNRVLGLMQTEIASARRVETGSVASPLAAIDSTYCDPSGSLQRQTILILRGATSADDISYDLSTPTGSNPWRGPSVLRRCGRLYSSGSIQTTGNRRDEVVLDSLQSGGFTATSNTVSGNSVNRSLLLSLISNASGTALTSSVQVALNSNTVYGLLNNLRDSSCSTASNGCASSDSTTTHWRPNAGDTINGDYGKEDVIYFDGNKEQYTITGIGSGSRCVNGYTNESPPSNCRVKKTGESATTEINSGDLLVFRNGEIRIPGN